MKVQAFFISLLLLTLLSCGESRSLGTNSQCATSCEAPTSFLYQPGRVYNYLYSATVQSSFVAGPDVSPGQQSEVNIQANVELFIYTPCEHALRISRVSLDQKDQDYLDTSEWERSLTQNPIHFSFQGGRIGDVCVSNNDPEWVLNIKRGIISTLQVSSYENNEVVVETDVTGTCTSSYTVESNGDVKTVRKIKDFNSCKENEKLLLFTHFTPYSSESPRQRLMIQKQTCTQTISGGIVNESVCSEEHLFRPFSSEDNGARTVVSQALRFSHGERFSIDAAEDSQTRRRTTLVFEKELEPESRQDITEITELLGHLCDGIKSQHTYSQVGKDFVNLIGLLRRLDGIAVGEAYDSLEETCASNPDILKSMFKDALKWCGSESCVQFGTKLISRGWIDDETALKWLLGMNMISEPTPAMVEGLLLVLQSGRFPAQTYLTTGTLINGICSQNKNCLNISPVRRALNFFEEKLGRNCYTPNEERKQEILLTLRALGNAGRSNAVNILASCAKEQRNDAETRLAAIQTFRRMPCGTDRSLESIVFDIEEDSEIRIGAYTITMKCPSTNFMSKLVMMMDTEPSQQVASYISTHLRNLIASSDPLKGYIKPYLVEAEFAKEYNLDPRKFSQYFELSYFSEPLNAGITAESSLVWSPKSFVPRSAGLNMTVDIFGQAVNIFEVGGRLEGIEGLLQDLMKDKSFLQNTGIGKIFGKDELDVDSDDSEIVDEATGRVTRDTSEARVNEKKEQYRNSINKDQFGASWYVRVFGNELKYGNSRFPDVYEKINEEMSSIVMDIAQGKQVKYHDDMLLMNTANTIPTLVGLPLTLAINGSASVDILGEGSMDLSSLLSTTPKLVMNAQLYPRATVVFNGAMSVDAHVTRTGIQTESTALMSWKVSGQAALAEGKKFSLRIDTPTHGSRVLTFEHNLLKVVGERTEPASDTIIYTRYMDCPSVFGEKLCIEKSPLEDIPLFPPSGTLFYDVYFEHNERNVDYYQFDLSYDFVKDEQMIPSYIMGDITFDSSDPSQVHRHNLRFELERDTGTVSSTMQYPTADGTTKTDFVAQYAKIQSQHSVRVTMNQDGTETQLMQTVYANNMHEALPKISFDSSWYIMGRERQISVDGAYMPSKLISFNSSLVNFVDRPIELKVDLADESVEEQQRFRVRGNSLVVIPNIYEDGFDFEVNINALPDNYVAALMYTWKDQDEQSLRFIHNNVATENHLATTFKFVSTQFPTLNAFLTTDKKQSEGTLETSAKLSYGENALERNLHNCISLSQMFSSAGSNENRTSMRGDIKVLVPFMGLRKSLSWNLAVEQTEIDTSVRYNGEDFLQITMRDLTRSAGFMSKSFKFLIPTPWENIVWEQNVQETETNVYKANGEIRVGNSIGMDFQTSAVLENLAATKSFAFEISENNSQIFSISLQHALLEPPGFTTTNTLESSYFGPVRINLRHEGAPDGSFATETLVEYSSQHHYKVNLDFDNSVKRKCQLSAEVEFLSVYGSMQEFLFNTTTSGSSMVKTTLLFSLEERNSLEISGSLRWGEASLGSRFNFGVQYSASDDQTHTARISFQNLIYDRYLPATMSIEVTANIAGEEKEIYVVFGENLLTLDLTVADDVRGIFHNSLYPLYPEQFELLLTGSPHSVTARISADHQVLNVTVRAYHNNLLVEFENTFTQLSVVPQRVVYDLSWVTNYGKTGTWTTLQVDKQLASFEAFCTYTRCEISFNLDNLTLDYLPEGFSRYTLSSVSASVDVNFDTNLYAIELLWDDEKVLTAEVNASTKARRNYPPWHVSIQQRLTPALPRFIKLTGTIQLDHQQISLNWDDTYTVLSLEYHLSYLLVFLSGYFPFVLSDVRIMYFSNCSAIAGDYKFTLVPDSNSVVLTVNIDRKLATAKLTPHFSRNSILLRGMSFDFQQNVSDRWYNDVTGTTLIERTRYMWSIKTTMKADYLRERLVELAFTTNAEPSGNQLKNKLELRQNSYVEVFGILLPNEMYVEFYRPLNSSTTEYRTKARTRTKYMLPRDLEMEFEIKLERVGDDFILAHTYQNGLIAAMWENEMFDYSIETTITKKGISIVGNLTLDPDTTYIVTVESNGEIDGNFLIMNTNIETNVFEMFDFGVKLPKQLNSTIRVGVSLDDESMSSGGVNFNYEITRVYVELGEDVTRVNYLELDFNMELFSLNFELSGKHDFEDFDIIPTNFKYELIVSGSTSTSPVFYKSAALSVTTGANTHTSSFSLQRNAVDKSIYASVTHNVPRFLEYGVPGNMSIAFRPKSSNDFDISIVYDTSHKSVGFTFDHVADLNKVIFDVYHNFDMLTQQLNIPKEMGFEGQYQLNERDYYANVRTKFGQDIRASDFILRWDGETFPELTSVTYRHSQNFTKQPYMPQKLRVKLARSLDNAEFSARSTIDDDQIRLNLNAESAAGEYSPSLHIAQNINKNYPCRLKVIGTLNTVEPHLEIKVESGSHNLSSDDPSFKASFESGFDVESKSMYLQFTHDQSEWKNLGLALVTRFDGKLYAEDMFALTLRLLRDEIENGVSVTFNRNAARHGWMLFASVSHDITEIVAVIPSNIQGRFYGEYSSEGLLANINITLNEDIYAHAINLTPTANGYTTDITFTHDSSYFTEFELPNSVGLRLAGEYNEESVSGSFIINYGQDIISAQLQAGPAPKMEVSFILRSAAFNYYGEAQFTVRKDDLAMALTLNGDNISSVRVKVGVDEVEINLHQQFETTILPSDIILTYSRNNNSKIDLSVQVARQEKPSLSFSLKPTINGSFVNLQLNDGVVKTLFSEYSLGQGSLSFNLKQNIFESNAPRSAGFTASFEGDTKRPVVFASFNLDNTTNTVSAQADLKEMFFSFEHDLQIPLLPRSMNAKVGYSFEETLSFEATVNVDDAFARGTMNIYLGEEKGADIHIKHNVPTWVTSPFSVSAKYSETGAYNFDLSTKVAQITGSINVNIDLEKRTAQFTHAYAARTDYSIPREIYVKADASLEQPIIAEFLTRVDGVERSLSINLDLTNNVYTFKQIIPELYSFPQTCVLSFSGSLEPFEAKAQLVMDSKIRDVFLSSSYGRLALSHSIPELDSMIPTTIDITIDFNKNTGNAMLNYTLRGSDRHISVEYDFQPDKQNGIQDMPLTIGVEFFVDNKYHNVSANLVPNRNFFNIKGGLLLYHDIGGVWYGAGLSINHNLNELSRIIEPSTTLFLKARKFEVHAVVRNGRNVDYSATGEVQIQDSCSGSKTVKVSYEHFLNSNSIHVEFGGSKIDNRYHAFFNARQAESQETINNIQLSLDHSFNDSFMIATTMGMTQNYESLEMTLPRSIENGRFEIIVSPREKRGQVSMIATVDRDQLDFSTSVEVDDDDRIDAQVALNYTAINLRSTLHMHSKPGQAQFSVTNRYRDNNIDRDDRITVQISSTAEHSFIEISAPIKELKNMEIPTNYRAERLLQYTHDSGLRDFFRASAGDYNITLTISATANFSHSETMVEFNQNIVDPNDITLEILESGRNHCYHFCFIMSDSTSFILQIGKNMTAELIVTQTYPGFRYDFSFTSFENTFSFEYWDTGLVVRVNNNLLTAYFSLDYDEKIALRFDYGSENVITLNALLELGGEGNVVTLRAGFADKSFVITFTNPDSDTYNLKVVENNGELSVDIAHLVVVLETTSSKIDFKFELFINDHFDTVFKVSLDKKKPGIITYKLSTPDDVIKTSFTLTLGRQTLATTLSFSSIQNIFSTSFNFSKDQSGYSFDGQFQFQKVNWETPTVFAISHCFESISNFISTSAYIRIMELPVTSFSALLSHDITESSYNYSLIANLDNGGLSQYVGFRTLFIAAWQQSENSGRKILPSGSYTVAVDDEKYHLSFDSRFRSFSRFDIDFHTRQPHTIEIFGLPIPKNNDFGFSMLTRKQRGVRITVDYNSEFLASPVKFIKTWRSGNDGSIDGSLSIEYDTSDILEVAYVFERLPDNGGHMITFNVQHQPSTTSFEIYLMDIQSARERGFKASLVNMKSTGSSEKWLLKIVYDYNDHVFKIMANQPSFVEPVSISFDYHSLINQVSGKITELIESAIDTSIVYGTEPVEGGYDIFIGLEVAEGKNYTINFKVTAEETTATAEIYIRDTNAAVTGIVDVKFSLVDGRFLKFHLRANPKLASAIEDVLLILEAEFNNKINMLVINILDLLNTQLSSSVTGNKQVADVIKVIVAKVTAARERGSSVVSESITSVTGMFKHEEFVLAENIRTEIVHLIEVIANANKILLQPFDDFVDTFYGEFSSEANSYLSACLASVKGTLDVINAGDLFIEAVEDAINQITEYLRFNGDELFFSIRGSMNDLVAVTENEITITIPLSFELKNVNFTALPTIETVESWLVKTSFSEHARELIPKMYAYVDHFYRVKAFLNTPLSEQVPPFKGHAFVSDFKSFRTFDGRHFDFDSNCESSHILTTDGSNFTIIMKYGSTPSFHIRAGSEDIIITADEQVTVNQHNPAILPVITASGLTIKRIGATIKLVYNDDIAIDFDTKINLFTIVINPFYFAATGGLLGVYDNEPNFDYVTPSGQRVDDVMAFVKSWEVSSTLCARKNQITRVISAPYKCYDLFSSKNSPFRACFPVVSPQAFTDMCLLDDADLCKIAKSYQYTCQLVGASIDMPEDCMQCNDASGQTFSIGESRSVDIDSVDVVMVIQEASCFRSRSKPLGKFLRRFLKQLTSSFRAIQLSDVKFYIVGYGGRDANSEPHIYTTRGGNIFTSRKSDVAKVIRKIKLSPEGTPSDQAIPAIDFASKLSFRSDAQQVIVHFSCDECAESAMAAQVERNLQERNIAFHHMPIRAIDTDNDEHVYGYSENQTFAKKTKNLDRSLISESTTDQCLPIALHSRGSVWGGVDMKSGDLVNLFSDYLIVNITPGETHTCTCEVNELGAPATRCVSG